MHIACLVMKTSLFRVQLLAVLFSIFFISAAFIDCKHENQKTGKSFQGSSAVHRKTEKTATLDSLYVLWETVQKLLVNSVGSQAEQVIDEIRRHFSAIERTVDVLEALQDQTVINSINELISTLFTGLQDAVESNKAQLEKGSFVSSEAFGKVLSMYENRIMKSLKQSRMLPEPIKEQLTNSIPDLFENLLQIYSEITKAIGMGIPGVMLVTYLPKLIQFGSMASVTVDTFKHVANIKTDAMRALEEFVSEYLTPDKIQMLSLVLTMLVQNMPARHDEV
ncbi:hypothetical protein MDAP_002288 [Mitosporidium daphniae]|uniref:Uncharacterized protein n=1 Tax=Mitosporidium daphniae TaxID=1485682 RepID=A0A098VS46_9MICR|nr:uncharacterized protein DI09_65p90 [Mitosporidium daphniae]KGG50561.1 hypothetical protein DI09_65p90 [Mitosporidium daphniae]|eukprot:XP_013237000.1 uncharacterized protein DI09_65p90 [Mitosporidium daphniae]